LDKEEKGKKRKEKGKGGKKKDEKLVKNEEVNGGRTVCLNSKQRNPQLF